MKAGNNIPGLSSGAWHLAAVIVTTLLALAVSVYSVSHGRFTVFQNLFYFPIIIACIYYLKRGFIFSVGLTFLYFFLFTAHTADFILIQEALIRVVVFILIAGVVTFISLRRRQAEETIRRISAVQNLILENSTMGIALVRNRTFEWINARLGEMLMLPIEQIQGFPTRVIYPSDEVYEELGNKAYTILGKGAEHSETVLQLRRSNGTLFWCRFIGKALNPANPQDGSIWMFEDITERKKAQDELQKKNLELAAAYEELKSKQNMVIQQEKMASIGMLAAGITHELKNPLSIVLQGIDYLQTAGMDNALMIEVVERMNKALLRADVIVKGLLSYTRQEVLSLTRQDIQVLIDDSLVLIEYELHRKNLQVVKQYAPDLPSVYVDGNQIKQVFVNILLNGVDAMPPKGTFTISVRQMENASGKDILHISFKDTGHGIPADKIKNIFDPFYTTKNIGNTGLGLSISKGIIDSHGGRIYAESENEQGANFIIELPVPREA